MPIKIFHGSLVADIEKFYPTSHFSYNVEQVKTVIGGKIFLDNEHGKPTLYECVIDLLPEQVKTVEDIGSPNIPAILLAYCGRDARCRDERFRNRPREDAPWLESIAFLQQLATEDGFVALEYENDVELGGKCLCVLFPEQVEILSRIPIEADEIKVAFNSCAAFQNSPFSRSPPEPRQSTNFR